MVPETRLKGFANSVYNAAAGISLELFLVCLFLVSGFIVCVFWWAIFR